MGKTFIEKMITMVQNKLKLKKYILLLKHDGPETLIRGKIWEKHSLKTDKKH